jgi:hypothetical protein
MIPRSKLVLSLSAVLAAFVLLLAARLVLASAASPPEPPDLGAAATGSPGPRTGRDAWTMTRFSPSEAGDTRWKVAGYNGVSGTSVGRNGVPTLYVPHADLNSTLYVQNPSENPGTLWADFYDLGGILVDTEAIDIPAYGSVTVDVDGLPGLPPDYEGSVDCRSDTPIQAVVDTEPDDADALVSYNALKMGHDRVFLPAVFRELADWNSSFWIKNVGEFSADVLLTFHGPGGSVVYVTSDSVEPSASLAYRLEDETGLPGMYQGLVLIESSQPVVVAVETLNAVTGQGVAWQGIAQAHGDPTALAPLQQKTAGVNQTVSLIANMGGAPISMYTEWYAGDGSVIHTDQDDNVNPGQVVDYIPDLIPEIPDGYDGSIVTDNDDQLIGGIIRWSDLTLTGDQVAESPAIGLGQAADVAYLPRVVHGESPGAFTEFSILNAASADTPVMATISFYDQSGALSATTTDVIPFRGVGRYGTGDYPALDGDWQGSVIVEATQPVVVEARRFVSEVVERHFVYLPVVLRDHDVVPALPLLNGDFELGAVIWGQDADHGYPIILQDDSMPVDAHSGSWATWLGGAYDNFSVIWQDVTVMASDPTLRFYRWDASEDICGYDYGYVFVDHSAVAAWDLCADANTGGWVWSGVDLSAYAGQTVEIAIGASTDSSLNSNSFIDDVTLGGYADADLGIPQAPAGFDDAAVLQMITDLGLAQRPGSEPAFRPPAQPLDLPGLVDLSH